MPDLPRVEQDFSADGSDYIAGIQAMIDQTQRLIDKVEELSQAIRDLPDVTELAINVTGNAEEAIARIREDLRTLDGRDVEVNIVYKNMGRQAPPEDTTTTQYVKQVDVPARETPPEESYEPATEGFAGLTADDVNMLRGYERILEANRRTMAEMEGTVSEVGQEWNAYAGSAGLAAAADEMMTRAMNDTSLSATQQAALIRAATGAMRELRVSGVTTSADLIAASKARAEADDAELASIHDLIQGLQTVDEAYQSTAAGQRQAAADTDRVDQALQESRLELAEIEQATQDYGDRVHWLQEVQEAARESMMSDRFAYEDLTSSLEQMGASQDDVLGRLPELADASGVSLQRLAQEMSSEISKWQEMGHSAEEVTRALAQSIEDTLGPTEAQMQGLRDSFNNAFGAMAMDSTDARVSIANLEDTIAKGNQDNGIWAAGVNEAVDGMKKAAVAADLLREAELNLNVANMQMDAGIAAAEGHTESLAGIMAQVRAIVGATTETTQVSAADWKALGDAALGGAETFQIASVRAGRWSAANNKTTASLQSLTDGAKEAGDEAGITGANMLAMALAAKSAKDNIGGLTIPLGLAAFGITGLGTAVHLVTMGIVEFLATFVPAMVAAGAAAAVLVQGMDDVYTGLSSVEAVGESLGPTFGKTQGDMIGLGHSLQVAQNAADPVAYELLGEAIQGVDHVTGSTGSTAQLTGNALKGLSDQANNTSQSMGSVSHTTSDANQKISSFGQMGTAVGQVLQNFGARVDADLVSNMGTVNTVLSKGVQDLVMYGQILGNLGMAVLNLAAKMPGLAEIILAVIDGISQLIKWFSNLNSTFIAVFFGFEEAYRWSGLLVGIFGLLGRAIALVGTLGIPVLAKIGLNMGQMAANFLTGIGGMIANFGALVERIQIGAQQIFTSNEEIQAAEARTVAANAQLAESFSAMSGVTVEEMTAMTGATEADMARMAASMGLAEGEMAAEVGGFDAVLTKMTSGLGSAATFMAGPWGAAIMIAVAGLTALALWLSNTKNAVEQYAAAQQKAVQAASNLEVLNVIQNDLAQNATKLAAANRVVTQTQDEAAHSASINAQQIDESSVAYIKAANASQVLSGLQRQLVTEGANTISNAAAISKEYGINYSAALGLADVAGVKLDNTTVKFGSDASDAGLKIQGLVAGYGALSQSGTTLANSMNAVTIEAGIQGSQITKVNQAWDQFITMSTSLTSSFAQLNDDLQQMGNVAATAGSKISALSEDPSQGGIQLSLKQIQVALEKFGGTSDQVWQNFDTSVTAANTFADNLRTGMAANVVTAGQYKQGIASVVGELLPFAAKSATAVSELSALAQEAGGPATSSYRTLKDWVDKNADSSGNFSSMIDKLTQKLSNVTSVARNFAGTLQSDVLTAIANAATATSGVAGLTAKYTEALEHNSPVSKTVADAQKNLDDKLKDLNFSQKTVTQVNNELTSAYGQNAGAAGTVKDATKDMGSEMQNVRNGPLVGLGGGINTVTDQAQTFANQLDPNLTGAIHNTGSAMQPLTQQSLTQMLTGTKDNTRQAQSLAQILDPMLTGSAGHAQSSAKNLKSSGLDPLISGLESTHTWTGKTTTGLNNLPKNEHTKYNLTAGGGASITSSIAGVAKGIIHILGFAEGGVVPGHDTGRDTVPAMLRPEEGVLVPQAVRRLGGARGLAAINRNAQHFAEGGVVLPDVVGSANQMATDANRVFSQTFQQVMNKSAQSVAKETKSAMQAITGLLSGAGVSNKSAEAALMSAAQKAGWTGAQWQALFNVEMREAGFSLTARNPSSGAYGMAQFINGASEYAQYGGNANTAAGQAIAMVNYIRQRYGTPEKAWGHEVSYGWYDKGGFLAPGLNMAYNGTGQPEKVTSPSGGGGDDQMMVHAAIHIDGKKFLDAIAPAAMQKSSRNNGNANSSRYWLPGNN